MVATVISATVSAYGLDRYLSPSTAAHDQLNPEGPSERVAHCSTIGDCQPESFLFDVRRVREDFGKTNLELETYHVILSHSHEELDPDNEFHVWLAHQFAREEMARAFPGRQIKIVTQADNGRWEVSADTGEKVWVKGKIHSHCQIANVAEEAVTLKWRDKDGHVKEAHYPAGRAFSSEMKNIYRVRAVTDEVVQEMFAYDNEAYMRACREHAQASGMGPGDRQALARQAEGKTNHYEELRMRLRVARATATDWDDFTAQLAADGVHVQRRGGQGDGVSYKWLDTPAARAGGRSGVGEEYKFRAVVEQCEENAAAIERGEELEVPERSLVVPTNSMDAERPRPVYQTADGKPPWEQGSDAYAEYVRSQGGTYEGRAAAALVSGSDTEGVELVRDGNAVIATVDTGVGPLVVDVDRELTRRAERVESEWSQLVQSAEELKGEQMALAQDQEALDARAAEIDGEVDEARQQAETIIVEARTKAAAIEAEAKKREQSGYSAGYQAGSAEGRAEGRVAGRKECLAEMEPEVEAAKADRADAAASLARQQRAEADLAERLEREEAEKCAEADRRVADYEAEQKAKVPAYDPKAAEEHAPAELIRNVKRLNADGSLRSGPDDPKERLTTKLHAMGVANHKKDRTGVSEKQFMTETTTQRGERIRETTAKLAGQAEAQSEQKQAGHGRGR